ncbi:transporter substrate-binding domain-containing protein [Dactylosporangium sp. NPDC051541]|uniref:transporter substrate-binding domain-containing protein n=1 Tax=Dactylosporangium sp. NPDC051541 TaxID=3363977 RepID=UPI0037B38AB8
MSTTDDEPAERPRSLRDELHWLTPVLLLLACLVALLLLNQKWGANVAGILTLPVEAVGVVMSILIARGVWGGRKGDGAPAPPRRRRRLVAAVTVVALAIVSVVVWLWEREPDPFDYMAGDVRIGFVDPGYPGWNEGTSSSRSGFDVAVARALLDYFPDMKSIQWVPLTRLDDRLEALEGPWGDDQLKPVKLVIANFSITEGRRKRIDFAGPYFNDAEGFATHNKSATSLPDVKKACVPAGSTAEDRLRKLQIQPVVETTVQGCFQRFFRNDDPELTVSTDLSIVQAYVNALPADKRQEVPNFVNIGTEQYGVGLPNNSPNLCAKINEALEKYMQLGWQSDFDDSLGRLGVQSTVTKPRIDRNPQRTDPCEPAAPWRK